MTVCILDTETTSKSDDREPIEVALLALPRGNDLFGPNEDIIPDLSGIPEMRFSGRLKPSKPLTFGSIAVHHILPEELEGMPPSSDFRLPDGVEYICGHSVDFDWEALGKPDVKRICTHAMSKAIWPTADSHSQSALLYMLNGPTEMTRRMLKDAHSASADVSSNLILLEYILAAKPEIRSWSALYAFSEEARIPTIMFMGRNKGAPIAELESGEIEWYLDRDFIDTYQRAALEREMKSRRAAHATARDDDTDLPF